MFVAQPMFILGRTLRIEFHQTQSYEISQRSLIIKFMCLRAAHLGGTGLEICTFSDSDVMCAPDCQLSQGLLVLVDNWHVGYSPPSISVLSKGG